MFPHLAGRHQSVFCTDTEMLPWWVVITYIGFTTHSMRGWNQHVHKRCLWGGGLTISYLDLTWLTEQILIELEILWVESEIFIRQHVTHASFFSAAPIFGHRCRAAVLRQNTWLAKHTWHAYYRFNPGSSTKYLVRQIFRINFCWRHIWAQAVGSGWLAFP